ncbi:sensor histidine kinase [Paradesulfitobacterium ferrireducens]|uniref:sensor histidine kinase n=1 Tax=Paradesulfitobacterium ferrireducens TaxID=2816476 RepID=UPI001A90BCB5|nr:ATP-binding protein [Paradesulfitobacterium ferrireducens]
MDIIKKAFPLITIIMAQLLILALLNLSFNIHENVFPAGTMANFLLPVNILLIVLALSSLALINSTLRNLEREIETQVRLESLEHLKDLLQTMRSQRHDFNHHLQTIYGFLAVEAYAEAKNYLEQILSEVYLTNEIIRANDPALNALLYVKSGLMERYGIEFSVDAKGSVRYPLKASEMNTLVGNLLDNALEKLILAHVEHPRVALKAFNQEEQFILAVTDNGPMIDPAHRDELFTPGFTTKQQGQGLGLYTVKQLAERYRGSIQVSSEEGLTTFQVSLPVQKGGLK